MGAFLLPSFVELNLCRCRKLFPDSPILVSDDKSDKSDEIKDLAGKHDAYYTVGTAPRGHFAGDLQCGINGIVFCEQQQCDLMLKLSMRLVPVLPKFRELIEQPFIDDPNLKILVPGRIHPGQIARTESRFFGGFGILSDVYVLRRGAISAELFKQGYEAGYVNGRHHPSNVVECYLGKLMAEKFRGQSYVCDALANHVPGSAYIFLRKHQCTSKNYEMVAAMDGLKGEYDVSEYARMLGRNYFSRPWIQSR